MNNHISPLFLKILLLLTVTFQVGFSQISKSPTFLWAIFTKGDSVPSFLYGTIHHLGPKPLLDNKKLLKLILSSDLIVMEADTTELFHPTKLKFDFTVDTPLDNLIGFQDYQMVQQEFFEATGKQLENYKFKMPQMILNIIEEGRDDQDPTFEPKPIMENALYAASRVKGIPIEGLETREDMFRIMYQGMPLEIQAKLLLYYLKDMKFNTTDAQLLPCFQNQDLNCFCQIEDMSHYTKPGDSTIIISRNLFWLPKIENHLKQKNIFIGVGAAHLCGDYGIVALLKKKGYILIPMKL